MRGTGREHIFHSTILKPDYTSRTAITDLFNSPDGRSPSIEANLEEELHDERDSGFKESIYKGFDVSVVKSGVNVFDEFSLHSDASIMGKHYILYMNYPGTKKQHFKTR